MSGTQYVGAYLPSEHIDRLRHLGGGNLSEGLRIILRDAFENREHIGVGLSDKSMPKPFDTGAQ